MGGRHHDGFIARFAENLGRLLPAYDILARPNRFPQPVSYRIEVNHPILK